MGVGGEILILLRKNLIRKGDLIMVRVIHKPTNLIISDDTTQV